MGDEPVFEIDSKTVIDFKSDFALNRTEKLMHRRDISGTISAPADMIVNLGSITFPADSLGIYRINPLLAALSLHDHGATGAVLPSIHSEAINAGDTVSDSKAYGPTLIR